jgi:predicted phage terminase large subunit-like protein
MTTDSTELNLDLVANELGFTKDDLQEMLANIDELQDEEIAEIEEMFHVLQTREQNKLAYDDLIAFCKKMQPDYLVGKHHRILADMLMGIEYGDKDRICVNIPPRHGKSQLVSIMFPAWFLGRNPDKKVMMVSHTTDLAVDFGRKVRNLIATPQYKDIFPTVALAQDSKSAGRWNTNSGGEYYACGIGSALAGRGADLLLVDDPHSEQDVINGNFDVFEKAYEWFTYGARTRLMPGGRVAIIQTRWHMDDLTGRVVKDMTQHDRADQYEIVEFPAILEVDDKETGKAVQKPLWPEFFDLDALLRTKASMPNFQWNAQYQQQPTAEEASVIKREWWNTWGNDVPPHCEYIIMSLDAAAETHNRADFTALTTWGVFFNEETDAYNIILLNSIKDRYEFPELKKLAMEQYSEWDPDSFIVEKKSAGTALYQEMRRMGLPVSEFTPHRGSGDKMARLNSVADIVASGMVWVPPTRWAEEVIEEIAGFPFMSHDDLVDSTVMALMRFRQGGFIRLPTDEPEEIQYFKQRRSGYY